MKKKEKGFDTHTPIGPTGKAEMPNKCRNCNGTGRIVFRLGAKPPWINCDICEGTGFAEPNLLWRIWGSMLYDWRIKEGLTLRASARKYKIDPSNLSKMERGFMNPDASYMHKTIFKKPHDRQERIH